MNHLLTLAKDNTMSLVSKIFTKYRNIVTIVINCKVRCY